MKWLPTVDGAVNGCFVVRIVQDADGTVLHLMDGGTVRSTAMFQVVGGELTVIASNCDEDEDIEF
jgi:hypothetical protein